MKKSSVFNPGLFSLNHFFKLIIMKRLLTAAAVTLYSLSIAQIKTGTIYISGQADYAKEEKNSSNFTEQILKIIPTVGIFVVPNLAVGTGLGYTHRQLDNHQTIYNGPITSIIDYTGKTNAVIVAPFIRKYWTLSEKLYFFGQLQVPMEFGKIKQDGLVNNIYEPDGYIIGQQILDDEYQYTSLGINVMPGVDYFLNKNWSIEAMIGELGYKNLKYKDTDDRNRKNYNFGFNLSAVSFGVKYVFVK